MTEFSSYNVIDSDYLTAAKEETKYIDDTKEIKVRPWYILIVFYKL